MEMVERFLRNGNGCIFKPEVSTDLSHILKNNRHGLLIYFTDPKK